jgi:ankyrin repeat protein
LTPLHLAALNGREEVVRFLVSKNALINVEDAEENTPLHAAARGGHLGVVTILLDAAATAGGTPLFNAKNKLGLTAGAAALLHGHIDIANKLVAQGWDPDQVGPEKFSLLHLSAAVGRSDAVSWLLENGSGNVDDARNTEKLTPLHCAAVSGDIDTCRVLLDARADVDAVGRKQQRPCDMIPLNADTATKLRDLLKPSTSPAVSNTTATKAPLSSSRMSRHAAFVSLPQEDQIRRARKWTSLHPTELQEALESYPGAEEAIRRVKMATELKKTVEIMKAMASLRCNEEFQKDIAQPSVYKAVMTLRKNPTVYDSLAQDLKVKSVVAKMGRIHAVVQANGQRTFSIEELIVPVGEINLHEIKDKEMIGGAIHAMECQLAGAAAAAAASSKKEAVDVAERAVNQMKVGQWKKTAVDKVEDKVVEKIEEDTRVSKNRKTTTTSKEAVWQQAERETSIFDQAIEDEAEARWGRNRKLILVLLLVLIVWIVSLMHRWGMFYPRVEGTVDVELDGAEIQIDGVKLDL